MTGEERDDAVPDDTVRLSRASIVPDDQTVRVARTASVPPSIPAGDSSEPDEADQSDPPDDATVISRGRAGSDTQPADEPDIAPGPRRHGSGADAEEPDDGSTMVAHRESRRRAAREESPVAGAPVAENSADDLPAPIGRIAQAPGEVALIYKPRAPEAVIVTRSTPPPRPPQPPIGARAATISRQRRARRLAAIAVIAGCFVVTVLLAALLAFTTTVGW